MTAVCIQLENTLLASYRVVNVLPPFACGVVPAEIVFFRNPDCVMPDMANLNAQGGNQRVVLIHIGSSGLSRLQLTL